MTHRSRVLFLAFSLVASACHSANWSPPEPVHGEPSVPPGSRLAPLGSVNRLEQSAGGGAGPIPAPQPEPSSSAAAPEPAAASGASATQPAESSSAPAASSEPPSGAAGAKPKSSAKQAQESPGAASVPSDAYAGPDPCQAKTFHYSAIGSACKKGGRKAVRDIMRGIVKKAKAAGQDIQCTSCHQDTSSFLLKPNAVSDIKQWF